MKDFIEKYKAFLYCFVSLLTVAGIAWGASGHLTGTYATHEEVAEVQADSKCGDIGYQLDKILQDLWDIESRYRHGQPMTPADRQRYEKLQKQLKKLERYEVSWGCEPEK